MTRTGRIKASGSCRHKFSTLTKQLKEGLGVRPSGHPCVVDRISTNYTGQFEKISYRDFLPCLSTRRTGEQVWRLCGTKDGEKKNFKKIRTRSHIMLSLIHSHTRTRKRKSTHDGSKLNRCLLWSFVFFLLRRYEWTLIGRTRFICWKNKIK